MEFKFTEIEEEVKKLWLEKQVFKAEIDHSKPKEYVLDMFPYPSGAGLHVGHPLGYFASDIIARYKRLKGFSVLHPMGYDSFGLPAEQYAIQTGQHPAITTEENIRTFREQMDKLGFSFDWSREIQTSDPKFYKWTQWIFTRLFNSWYNNKTDRAESISPLIGEFERNGNRNVVAAQGEGWWKELSFTLGNGNDGFFSAEEWNRFSDKQKSDILLNYRLAYLGDSWVNWCPALGTVLANDEVKDGVSERGGYPVERKQMKQWSLRITAYAERLLEGLKKIDWTLSLKEMQENWIGKSEGAIVRFEVESSGNNASIDVFTTRPDTIFGAAFITLAPEHALTLQIATTEYKDAVEEYVNYAKNRSERERMADVKRITGQFTGAYVIHPFTQKPLPVWVSEYVLATYGTGAVMGVPGHDERDHRFARHFGLPIISILDGVDVSENAFEEKTGILSNSGFMDGLSVPDAIRKAIGEIEKRNIGKRKVNYKMRDAIFGRQRYWGEPIPIYYDENGIPNTVDDEDLPLVLPEVDKYLPTESGEPPLARAKNWSYTPKSKAVTQPYPLETTTMPGWAGSSWYYLRYEDPFNDNEFASKEAINYWQNVDLYLGGDEHAIGHLLYFRFWTKFLFDLDKISFDEPAKKLVNQGKIQGISCLIARLPLMEEAYSPSAKELIPVFVSADVLEKELSRRGIDKKDVQWVHVNLSVCDGLKVKVDKLRLLREDFKNAEFIFNDEGSFYGMAAVEKMSKRYGNVINPNDVVSQYGADAFRLYEMFLGPLEQSKPWDTKGIDGVFRFLKKLLRLFYDDRGSWIVNDEDPTREELKILHRTLKKSEEDIEKLSFNTSVSAFMIAVNELTQLNTSKKKILEPLLVTISPYAPFLTEYLWQKMGHDNSILRASYPQYDNALLVEDSFEYPVAVNGKTRVKMNFALDLPNDQIEKEVTNAEALKKYFDGRQPKKVIVVKGRMINVVV